MNRASVFRSAEGREKIRAYYNNILNFFPFSQRFVETSFGRTFALEAGNEDNPAIVLIHGSCSNSAAWLGDMAAFAARFHVFAVDMPGEPGNSDDNRLNFESGEYPMWLSEVMDALGTKNAVIIGNSMGGWLALHFAASHPERTKALVLLAPSGIVPPRQTFTDQTANIANSPEKAGAVGETVLANASIPKEVLEFMNLVMTNFIPFTGALPVLTDEQMKALTMPVLYIAGTSDVTMDTTKAAQRLSELVPHAKVILGDGAHVITSAAETIIPFLEEEP